MTLFLRKGTEGAVTEPKLQLFKGVSCRLKGSVKLRDFKGSVQFVWMIGKQMLDQLNPLKSINL